MSEVNKDGLWYDAVTTSADSATSAAANAGRTRRRASGFEWGPMRSRRRRHSACDSFSANSHRRRLTYTMRAAGIFVSNFTNRSTLPAKVASTSGPHLSSRRDSSADGPRLELVRDSSRSQAMADCEVEMGVRPGDIRDRATLDRPRAVRAGEAGPAGAKRDSAENALPPKFAGLSMKSRSSKSGEAVTRSNSYSLSIAATLAAAFAWSSRPP
mmetsp:Transcript_692/g.2149  ORF Transcript_692/g.2149 Transcript_692/m.2149 type:complete len:213 (+) Transcript_692:472-1110(+)